MRPRGVAPPCCPASPRSCGIRVRIPAAPPGDPAPLPPPPPGNPAALSSRMPGILQGPAPRHHAGTTRDPAKRGGARPTLHHHIKFIISSGTNTLVDAHDDNHTAQDLPAFELLPNHNTSSPPPHHRAPSPPPAKGEQPLHPSASLPPHQQNKAETLLSSSQINMESGNSSCIEWKCFVTMAPSRAPDESCATQKPIRLNINAFFCFLFVFFESLQSLWN